MYQNYQQTFTPQQNQLIQQMLNNSYSQAPNLQQETHAIRVNGEPGARSFALPPNSDAILIDTTASIVWLVQTDGAGYKSLTPYDIFPHEVSKPDDSIKKLEDRLSRLEEKINSGEKSYDSSIKPYSSNSRSRKYEQQQYNATSSSSDDKG